QRNRTRSLQQNRRRRPQWNRHPNLQRNLHWSPLQPRIFHHKFQNVLFGFWFYIINNYTESSHGLIANLTAETKRHYVCIRSPGTRRYRVRSSRYRYSYDCDCIKFGVRDSCHVPLSFVPRLPPTGKVGDTVKQLNVLHQAASCSSCYDIRDIAIHVYTGRTTHMVAENYSTAHDRFRPSSSGSSDKHEEEGNQVEPAAEVSPEEVPKEEPEIALPPEASEPPVAEAAAEPPPTSDVVAPETTAEVPVDEQNQSAVVRILSQTSGKSDRGDKKSSISKLLTSKSISRSQGDADSKENFSSIWILRLRFPVEFTEEENPDFKKKTDRERTEKCQKQHTYAFELEATEWVPQQDPTVSPYIVDWNFEVRACGWHLNQASFVGLDELESILKVVRLLTRPHKILLMMSISDWSLENYTGNKRLGWRAKIRKLEEGFAMGNSGILLRKRETKRKSTNAKSVSRNPEESSFRWAFRDPDSRPTLNRRQNCVERRNVSTIDSDVTVDTTDEACE
ncbi:hypothetical protein CLF_112531, partial [Clonorchis sinensis]